MTGYGAGKASSGNAAVEVEIKALNHRFFDFSCKLPRPYSQYEGELRALINEHIERGRVELYVARRVVSRAAGQLSFDHGLFEAFFSLYVKALRRQGIVLNERNDFSREVKARIALEILRRSDVLEVSEDVAEGIQEREALVRAVRQALEALCLMRLKEGANLQREIKNRLKAVQKIVVRIERQAGETHAALKERLLSRIKKLSPEIMLDEGRLGMEVALLADRADITEELVRLNSHLSQFKESLFSSPNGRRFEFLLQEMGRELNTISAKAQSAGIQSYCVEARLELEKLREQVQNIE